MPARTGEQYINQLKQAENNVYIHGEKVEDVTNHPSFRNVVRSLASLYDLQYEKPDKMLYKSPSTGDKVGLSFIAPKTVDDLIARRLMIQEWATHSGGMMGRSPDYLNTSVMAFGTASDFFGKDNPMYGENAKKYYEYCRENDVSLTHTLISPQMNRSKALHEQKDPYVALHLVEKKEEGIIVSGARLLATLGGISDEILVFPSTVNKSPVKDDIYSLAFAIPNNTPGLKYVCRESFDYGGNQWDHPLSAQFEESDAIVIFDNVLVPWDRVFLCGDAVMCNETFAKTHSTIHMTHQVISKNIVKTEFVLGVALSIIDAIGIEKFQHVQDKAAEIMVVLETMKSHMYKAEHNAKLDEYGVMLPDFDPLNAARNWYPKIYPRLVEILRILGASGLMGIPTQADFQNEEIGDLVDRYTQGAFIGGYDRVQLFRLAWDITLSAFGGRQTHYEYYFFGDPVRMSMAYYDAFNKEPAKEMVKAFLDRAKAPQHNYVK